MWVMIGFNKSGEYVTEHHTRESAVRAAHKHVNDTGNGRAMVAEVYAKFKPVVETTVLKPDRPVAVDPSATDDLLVPIASAPLPPVPPGAGVATNMADPLVADDDMPF